MEAIRADLRGAFPQCPKSPKKSDEVRWKSENTRIFSCVGKIVGNIAYYRHILLIFQM